MTVYSVGKRKKQWRYDFKMNGKRYSSKLFLTKKEARQAEAERRIELKCPIQYVPTAEKMKEVTKQIQTGMDFLTFINLRCDHVERLSANHYKNYKYFAKRWLECWQKYNCDEITPSMIEGLLNDRYKVSAKAANTELEYLRALFNFGIKKGYIKDNPTKSFDFFPVTKTERYVPTKDDVQAVLNVADIEDREYLWCILATAARVNEINNWRWQDIDFDKRVAKLWTRKTKNGDYIARDVPMIPSLYDILKKRFDNRDPEKPWVFWHKYWDRKKKCQVVGPFSDRKRMLQVLCKKAGVKHFSFHPLRHLSASILADKNVPIHVIQRILGHSNIETTERYVRPIDNAMQKAMDVLETQDLLPLPADKPTVNESKKEGVHKEFKLRKAKRPPYDVLMKEIEEFGYRGTGKKYGVSDNAIRNWAKFYRNNLVAV